MELNKKVHINDLSKDEIAQKIKQKSEDILVPIYHITPPFGLLNDPNGVHQKNGITYIYYQWYPGGPTHGLKHWYLVFTEDFINYTSCGPSNIPDNIYDKDGAFSGSYVKLDNKDYVIYTGNVVDGDKVIQRQLIASIVKDGKIANKKLLIEDSSYFQDEFRDPIMYTKENQNYIITGAKSKEKGACFSVYELLDNQEVVKRKDLVNKYIDFANMYECPNFFNIHNKICILYSPQGAKSNIKGELDNHFNVVYQLVDDIDFKEGKFINESDYFEIDKGMDFYAPQVYKDEQGNLILIAWLGDGKSKYPDQEYGWSNCLTIPRLLTFKENYILQSPHPKLKNLRNNKKTYFGRYLNNINESFELNFQLEDNIKLNLGNKEYYISIDFQEDYIVFNREKMEKQINSLHSDIRFCSRLDKVQNIKIFVDVSAIEIFVNNGKNTITSRFYITDLKELNFSKDINFTVYNMSSIKL